MESDSFLAKEMGKCFDSFLTKSVSFYEMVQFL